MDGLILSLHDALRYVGAVFSAWVYLMSHKRTKTAIKLANIQGFCATDIHAET